MMTEATEDVVEIGTHLLEPVTPTPAPPSRLHYETVSLSWPSETENEGGPAREDDKSFSRHPPSQQHRLQQPRDTDEIAKDIDAGIAISSPGSPPP
ncbi:hypothetical protein PG996_010984 [Apiospora saccharicola]|uniref:Uncharacterized protein n=1 Tax=Apiospora saccharicola TaxID=335842 RepID=A0ABR1UDR8_9PEZI